MIPYAQLVVEEEHGSKMQFCWKIIFMKAIFVKEPLFSCQ